MNRWRTFARVILGMVVAPVVISAQAPVPPPTPPNPVRPGPWRMAGNVPCVGPWGGVYECPPAPGTVAIRAGRMFDSISGQMLTKQVIVITGERIVEVGPEGKVMPPAGARVINLSNATVLPGFIDTHTHVFNSRGKDDGEQSMLVAVENVRSNMRAGFTSLRDMGSHGNGFQDVDLKNAINRGAIDGPRMLVSGRGIAWGATPATGAPDEGLGNFIVRSAEEGRAAVRAVFQNGAEHIKLYPTGGYKFSPTGVAVWRDLSDGRASGDHRGDAKPARDGLPQLGGDGLRSAIVAGCDSDGARLQPHPGAGRH